MMTVILCGKDYPPQKYKSIDTDLIAEIRCHLGRIGNIVKTTLVSSLLRVALIWMNQ